MSGSYDTPGGAAARPENSGLRWLLAILVTSAADVHRDRDRAARRRRPGCRRGARLDTVHPGANPRRCRVVVGRRRFGLRRRHDPHLPADAATGVRRHEAGADGDPAARHERHDPVDRGLHRLGARRRSARVCRAHSARARRRGRHPADALDGAGLRPARCRRRRRLRERARRHRHARLLRRRGPRVRHRDLRRCGLRHRARVQDRPARRHRAGGRAQPRAAVPERRPADRARDPRNRRLARGVRRHQRGDRLGRDRCGRRHVADARPGCSTERRGGSRRPRCARSTTEQCRPTSRAGQQRWGAAEAVRARSRPTSRPRPTPAADRA